MAAAKLTYTLNTGKQMPLIGLGMFRVAGRDVYRVIDAGLKAGYRAFDTAAVYQNEVEIGDALKTLLPSYNLKREDIFITTKLAPNDHGKGVKRAVQRSLSNLQTPYVDLYLVHWPGVSGIPIESPKNAIIRDETWANLVELHHQGLLLAIGVSNYTVNHINELLANSHGVRPAVNQVECHPHYPQWELLQLCNANKILLQAYSSLGGTSELGLINDPTVCAVAKAVGRSSAQVLLRWALEQGIAIIPKSVTPQRIAENIDLGFSLPAQHMKTLNSLTTTQKYAWNPKNVV